MASRRRPAVRIPKNRRSAVSRRIRELVAKGYSPRYAARLAYERDRRRDPKRLTAAERRRLRPAQYALPARRALPIEDRTHVRNAAARLEQMRRRGTVTDREYRLARRRILQAEKRLGVGPFRRARLRS